MNDGDDLTAAGLEQALQQLAAEEGVELAHTIRPIILTNLQMRRGFLIDNPDDTHLSDYVYRVAGVYQEWRPYVQQIQEEKNETEWSTLFVKLQKWAYAFLRRNINGLGPDELTRKALACASDAAGLILRLRFPYDVHFDSWACPVLHNVCRKQIVKHFQRTGPRGELPLEPDHMAGEWSDPKSLNEILHTEKRRDVLDAIEQLSEKRREFIWLYYFEQNSFQEIAAKMNSNINALYKVHYDALEQLRKILGGEGDNNNEERS